MSAIIITEKRKNIYNLLIIMTNQSMHRATSDKPFSCKVLYIEEHPLPLGL